MITKQHSYTIHVVPCGNIYEKLKQRDMQSRLENFNGKRPEFVSRYSSNV